MTGPTYEEKRRIFERHFLLGKLSADEIDPLLSYSRVERYPAGEEIYPKGSPGQSMMVVLRGTAKMSSVSPDGKEIVLNIINSGEIFGEIALLDGEERSADAIAMTDCELLVVEPPRFHADPRTARRHMPDADQDPVPAVAAYQRTGRGRPVSPSRIADGQSAAAPRRKPGLHDFHGSSVEFISRSESSEISWAAAGRASTSSCKLARAGSDRHRQGLDRDPQRRGDRAPDLMAPLRPV